MSCRFRLWVGLMFIAAGHMGWDDSTAQEVALAPVADTWLANDENSGPNATHGSEGRIQLRNHPVRKRIAYVRYDITGLDSSMFNNATLSGNFEGSSYNGPGSGSYFNVYGLKDDVAASGGLMGNDWDELTTSYANASGVDQSAPLNSYGFTSDMVFLGTLAFDGVDAQPLPFASNPTDLPLGDFLGSDTDGLVTFAMISPDGVESEYRIRTKEYGFANNQTPILLTLRVPEPGGIAIASLAVVGVAAFVRRKRRHA